MAERPEVPVGSESSYLPLPRLVLEAVSLKVDLCTVVRLHDANLAEWWSNRVCL